MHIRGAYLTLPVVDRIVDRIPLRIGDRIGDRIVDRVVDRVLGTFVEFCLRIQARIRKCVCGVV